MKNLTKAVLATLVVATSLSACKKGDDDPGMSLKSRKGRLSQEWSVSEYKSDVTDFSTSYDYSTTPATKVERTDKTTKSYTGTSATMDESNTVVVAGVSSTDTYKYSGSVTSNKYSFDKEGTWSSETIIKWTSVTMTSGGVTTTQAIDITETSIQSGIWYFTGKNKSTEDKNKENLVLSVTKEQSKYNSVSTTGSSYTYMDDENYTYANNENVQVWHLSRLAKDELVADGTLDMSMNGTTTTSSSGTSNTTTSGPNTSKGSINITLAVE